MEELLQKQKTEVDELTRVLKNYSADGPSRKNGKYLKDKLSTFPELFRMIQENDQEIDKLRQPLHEEQPYFKKAVFSKLELMYEKTMTDIHKRIADLANPLDMSASSSLTATSQTSDKGPSGAQVDGPLKPNLPTNKVDFNDGEHIDERSKDDIDGGSDDLESFGEMTAGDNSILSLLYEELMDAIVAAANLDYQSSGGSVAAQLANMNSIWTEFRSAYLREKSDGREILFGYATVSHKYIKASGRLNDLALFINKRSEEPAQNCERSSNIQFNLPKLQLPEFNGKLSDWKRFIALFDRMVHNNSKVDNGIKIEYLKTCVKGQAARIINHIDPNPDNYATCYELLRKRFDNKREILGALIDNILQLPKIRSENADMLKSMHDTVYESIMSIKNIGVSTDNWDALLCHFLTRKLDSNTLIHYECQLEDVREPQPLGGLLKYLENRFMALQSAKTRGESHYDNYKNQSNNSKQERGENQYENHRNQSNNFKQEREERGKQEKQLKCLFCNNGHVVSKCESFLKKRVEDRIDWIRNKQLCLNCFSGMHKTHDCKSKFSCRTCSKRHNGILHLDKKINERSVKANVARTSEETETFHVSANVARQNTGSVLLATIILGAFDKNGARILLRALLDQGSQSAFISEKAAQTLKLPRKSIDVTISGIGAREQKAKHLIEMTMFPRFESDFILNCNAIILPRLTHVSNNTQFKDDFDFTENLTLADPSFLDDGEIDVILGASEYAAIIRMGLIKSEKNMIAQNTEFGWVLSGAFQSGPSARILSFITNVDLNETLQRFF